MNKLIRWIPAAIWILVIYYLSSQTGDHLNALLPFFRKWLPFISGFNWAHFAAYFILALTFYWGLGSGYSNIKGKIIVVVLCLFFGITDEYHQSFVEGRLSDVMDLRNDTIGAALAMLLFSLPSVHRLYLKMPDSKKY